MGRGLPWSPGLGATDPTASLLPRHCRVSCLHPPRTGPVEVSPCLQPLPERCGWLIPNHSWHVLLSLLVTAASKPPGLGACKNRNCNADPPSSSTT